MLEIWTRLQGLPGELGDSGPVGPPGPQVCILKLKWKIAIILRNISIDNKMAILTAWI